MMITVGIDVGAETVKAAIIKDKKVLASGILTVGFDESTSANEALKLVLREAGISSLDVQRITATGIGRKEVSFANSSVADIVADAQGVIFLFPSARTVIDIGAEEARAIRLNSLGKVLDFAKNDKCAAGVGAFVESMARALEIKIEEMGVISERSRKDISMDITCAVFGESEVVSLIHSQTPKEDIARAIHEAIATRSVSMMKRIGIEKDVVFFGGVAKNIGVVDKLSKHLEMDLLVPEDPQIVGAIGAALIAGTVG